jgi:hypothetical protein
VLYRSITIEERRMGRCKRILLDGMPDYLNLVREEVEIVYGSQPQPENFAGAKQVMKISSAEPGTSVAVTLRVERCVHLGEPALLDIDASRGSEQCSVASQSGR